MEFLGSGFGRTDFSRSFYFWAAGFFRGFSRRIFSPHFCGKKVPRKILQENPRKNPPKFIQQKSSDTFLQPTQFCRMAGARVFSQDLNVLVCCCGRVWEAKNKHENIENAEANEEETEFVVVCGQSL